MPKERRSEAIWKETSQRWQCNVQKDGKRKSFYSSLPGRKGKHECEAKADEWLEANQPDDIRFGSAWEIYLEHIKRNTGTANYTDIESIGRNWFMPSLSTKRMSKINMSDLQEIVTSAAEAGRSKRTCKNIKDKFSGFAHFAEDRHWICPTMKKVAIPTKAPSAKRKIVQPDKLRVLFSEDFVSIKGKTKKCFYIYAYRFIVSTGFRRGEFCGMRWEDYDGKCLKIQRSINRFEETTEGKNDNARRMVVLSKHAIGIIEDQKSMLKSMGIISPWIFPNPNGGRIRPNSLLDHWRKVYAKQHGIDTSIHELRHTFVSIAQTEVPEALLKQVVGHSASMDTDGVYGHEVDGDKQRAADMIDAVFSRVLG